MADNRKVRLIMMQPIYRKHAWPIPIIKEGDRFLTGQNLTLKQMTGEAELTESQREEYPVVINPLNIYRGIDRKIYHLEDPNDKAMYDIMLKSGKIARTEYDFKQKRDAYVGYFFDPDEEATTANYLADLRFEAESRIRRMSIEEYDKVLLALNYKVPGFDLGGSLKGLSPDRKRHEILKACEKYPEEVLNCFNDKNPGIDEELFIIEAISANILFQKQDGSIMFGPTYVADSIDGVKKFLSKEDNIHLRKRWKIMLDEKKGYASPGSAEKFMGKAYDNLTLEELVRFINNPANKIKRSEFKDILNDRDAIIQKLNVL